MTLRFILKATLLQHKICMKITVSWVEGRNVVTSQDPWKTGTKSCICSNLWKKMTQPVHTLSYTSNHLQIAYNTKYRAVNSYQPWQVCHVCQRLRSRGTPPLPWLVESTGTGAIGMGRLWDSYICKPNLNTQEIIRSHILFNSMTRARISGPFSLGCHAALTSLSSLGLLSRAARHG